MVESIKHRYTMAITLVLSVLVMCGIAFGGAIPQAYAADDDVVSDPVQRGSLEIFKYDAQTGLGYSQGGANLAGAKFTITNKSSNPVVFKDTYGHYSTYAVNESWEVGVRAFDSNGNAITDEDGNVLPGKSLNNVSYYAVKTASDALPYGSYHVQERTGSFGYALVDEPGQVNAGEVTNVLNNGEQNNEVWHNSGYDFTITSDGQKVTYKSTISNTTRNKNAAAGNYTASVASGAKGPGVFNQPLRGELHVLKQDFDFYQTDRSDQTPQGNGSLAGAKFKIYNANPFAVTFWGATEDESGLGHGTPQYTDANGDGWYEPGEYITTIVTNESGSASTTADALPYGTYKVIEDGAPEGYKAVTTPSYAYVGVHDVQANNWAKVQDKILRGGAAFNKKDDDLKESTPQGDAVLGDGRTGATITIWNVSKHDVYIYDQAQDRADGDTHSGRIKPGAVTRDSQGNITSVDKLTDANIVATIQTNAEGYAYIYGLPYGTYYAKETKPSTGYLLNEEWEVTFDIKGTQNDTVGNYIEITPTDKTPLYEKVIRGNIKGAKVDAETHQHSPLGGATLKGAKIRVQNVSRMPIVAYCDANGKSSETHRTIDVNGTVATLTTDDEGYFEIKDLPYGTYKLTESAAPEGYERDRNWVQYVQIRKDGKTYMLTEYNEAQYSQTAGGATEYSALADRVIRQDIHFSKKKNGEWLPGCIFKLQSNTTGEWHLLVTNKNGILETVAYEPDDQTDTSTDGSSGQPTWRLHTYRTNLSDAAYDEDAGLLTADVKYVSGHTPADAAADPQHIDIEIDATSVVTPDQGYWFYGYKGKPISTVNNIMAALPYDTYTLTELRCDANKGLTLTEQQIYIGKGQPSPAQHVINYLGDIDNTDYTEPDTVRPSYSWDILAVKSSNPANNTKVNPGQTITYTVSYENTLSYEVPSVQLRDYLPKGVTFVSAENDGAYVEATDSHGAYVEWTTDAVPVGGKGSVSYTVKVNANAPSVIVNQALFQVRDEKLTAGDNSNSDPAGATNIIRHTTDGTSTGYSLVSEKTAEPAAGTEVSKDDTITYKIKITNNGSDASPALGIYDEVPRGTVLDTVTDDQGYERDAIFVDDNGTLDTPLQKVVYPVNTDSDGHTRSIGWSIDPIPAGQSITVSFRVKVTDKAGYIIMNQATYGPSHGKVTECFPNATNTIEHPVLRKPEVSITKTSDVPDGGTIAAGNIVTYTLTVTNNGIGNAENIPVWDYIGSGTHYVAGSVSTEYSGQSASEARPYVSWVIPQLAHDGGTATMTYQVRVDDTVEAGTVLNNTASVGGTSPVVTNDMAQGTIEQVVQSIQSAHSSDPITKMSDIAISNTVAQTIVDPCADGSVEVVKTADPENESFIEPGSEITYTVTWTNNSDTAVNGFGIRDAIPEHTTFVPGSISVVDPTGASASANGVNTEPDEHANDGAVPAVPTPDSVVWTEVTTVGKAGQVDAEAVYDAVVWDRSTQSIPKWNEVRAWFETAQAGDELTFTVTNTAWYDMLWKAYVDDNDRVILLCHVIVDNLSNSVNYAGTDSMWANYDSAADAVYGVQTQLAPGETASMTFKVIVDENVPNNTDIKNHATFGGGVYGAPNGDLPNSSNETTHHVGAPQISVTKAVDKAYATDGDVITYTIEATNDGTATAYNVGLYDEFLPYEQSGLFYKPGSYSVTGSDSAVASKAYANALEMTSNVFRARASELAPGETIKWEFSMILDDVDTGTIIKNFATVGTNVPEGDFGALATKSNEVTTTVDEPELSISKAVDPEGPIAAGDTLTYTVTVTNTSNVDTDSVGFYDAIPHGTALVENSLSSNLTSQGNAVAAYNQAIAAGESATFSFSVVVNSQMIESNIVSNTATCGITDVMPTSPLPISSNATNNTVVSPNIRLVKTADPADGSFVAPGDEITYTLTAYNDGETIARGVGVYDKLPTGITYKSGDNYNQDANAIAALLGDIPAGQSKSISFKATVDSGFYGNITNYASWDYLLNAAPTRHSANKSNDVLLTSSSTVDISVVKTQSPEDGAEVMPGDTIHYKVVATNNAATNVEGFSIFDSAPTGTTYVEGSVKGGTEVERGLSAYAQYLKAGQSMTLEFDVTVDASASGMIVNEATWDYGLSAALTDKGPRMTNDVDAIVTPPELSITKTSDPADGTPVAAGDVITYTITVANDTEANATGIAIYDKLPANTTYVKNSATNGLSYVDGALVATGVNVDAGSTKSFVFKVKANEADADTVITNQASYGFASETPTAPLEHLSNVVTHVISKPDLRMVKSSSADGLQNVAPGDIIEYTVTVYNDGNVNATGVGMYDAIPEGTTYVEGSLTATGGVEGDGYVASYVGDVAAGESATMKFSVQVDADYYGAINNVASWDYLLSAAPTAPTANVSNNSGTTSGTPDISVVKTQDRPDGSLATPLDTITYTVRATNIGSATASGVGIYDVIPEGTTYVPGSLKVTNGEGEEVSYTVSDSTSATVVGSGDEAAAANAANTKVGAIQAYAEELAKGKSLTITYTVQIDLGYTGEIVNQATWDWGLNAAPVNELARLSNDVDVVSVFPTIDIYKVQNPPSGSFVAGGDQLTYTVVVKNNGEVTAHNVGIYDEAPEHTTYVEGSLSGDGEATVGEDGLLTIMAGDLEPGQSAKLTFKAEIDLGFTGVIHNRGLWVSPAATPEVKPIEGTESDETQANVEGAMVAGANFFQLPALINVVIPDGAASGWSNDTGDSEDNGNGNSGDNNSGNTGNNGGNTDNTGNTGDNSGNTGNIGDNGNNSGNAGDNSGNTGDNNSGNTGDNNGGNAGDNNAGDGNEGGNAGNNGDSGNSGNDNAGGSANQGSGSVPEYEVPGTGTTGDENEVLVPPEGNEGDGSNETHAIVVAPTVEFSKTSNPGDGAYVKMGDEVSYTLTVNNTGQANANYIVVEDVIPAGITLDESSIEANGLTVRVEDGKLIGTGNVAAGTTATITFKGTVSTDDPTELVNVAKIAQDKDGKLDEDDPFTESNTITIHAVEGDTTLIKSSDPADGSYVAQGDYVNYTIKVVNDGKVPVRPVVTDVLDSNVHYIDGSLKFSDNSKVESYDFETADATLMVACKEMAVGDELTITFKAKVIGDAAQDGKISNKASWTDADDDDNANVGDSNNVELNVGAPQIELTKVADPSDGSYVKKGDEVSYTVTARNTGNAAINYAVVEDVIPSGIELDASSVQSDKLDAKYEDGKVVATGSIAPGDTATITYKGTVVADGDADLTNVAKIAQEEDGSIDEGDPYTESNGVTVHAADADVTLIKSADPIDGSYIKQGDYVTYTIEVVNDGKVPARPVVVDQLDSDIRYADGSVSFSDASKVASYDFETSSATLTVNFKEMAVGESCTITFKAKVLDDAEQDAKIENKASWTDADNANNPNADDSNDVVLRAGEATIELTKASDPIDGSYVRTGDDVTFTITAKNVGENDNDYVIVDEIPEGFSVDADSIQAEGIEASLDGNKLNASGNIAKDATATITFTAKVTAEAGSDLVNVAKIGQHEINDKAIESNDVVIHVVAPEASVVKTVEPHDGSYVKVGDEVTYELVLTNTGKIDAATTITDVMDEHMRYVDGSVKFSDDSKVEFFDFETSNATLTVTSKELAPGESLTVTFKARVDAKAANGAVMKNVAKWADTEDENAIGESNEVVLRAGTPSIAISKASDPADGSYVRKGDTVNYTLTVQNIGSGTDEEAADVVNMAVLDEIPEGLEIDADSIQAEGIEASLDGNKLIANGEIAAGSEATITFAAMVTADAGTDLTNIAYAGQDEINDDAVASNDIVLHVVEPEASIVKTVTPDEGSYVKSGDVITYSLVVTNDGKIPAATKVTDVVDKNVRYVDGSIAFDDAEAVESYDFETSDALLTVTTKELAPGESVTITFQGKVVDNVEAGTMLKNVAKWNDVIDESIGGESNETEVVVGEPKIVMSKEVVSGDTPIVYDDETAAGSDDDANADNAAGTDGEGAANDDDAADSSDDETDGADNADGDAADNADGDDESGKTDESAGSDEAADAAVTDAQAAAKVYAPGDEVTYKLHVGNTGSMAGKVNFSDTLPTGVTYVDGTLTVGDENATASFVDGVLTYENTLEVGATDTITYTVKVDEGVYNTQLVNAVVYKVDGSDDPEPEQPSVVIETGSPDVKVAKTADKTSAVEGETVTYKISANNAGDVAATGVVVTDEFPAGLTYVAGSLAVLDAEGAVDESVNEADLLVKGEDGTITGLSYDVGTLEPGATSEFVTFQMMVNDMADDAEAVDATNIAKVVDSTSDEPKESEPVVVTLSQKPEPKLAINKEVLSSDENLGVTGAKVKYQITLSNSGNAAAENVAVKDLLPAGLTLDTDAQENKVGDEAKWVKDASASTDSATMYNYYQNVTVPAASDAAPGEIKLVFVAKTTAPLNGTLTNHAYAENADADADVKYKIEDEVPVKPDPKPANVSISKKLVKVNGSTDTKLYNPGDKLTYEITATNSGDVAATDYDVYDILGYYMTADEKTISASPAGKLLKNKFAVDDSIVKASGIDTSLFAKAQASGGTVNTTSAKVLGVSGDVITCMDDSFMTKGAGWVAVIGDTNNDGTKDSIEIAYVSTKADGTIDFINEYWFGSYVEPVDGKFTSAKSDVELDKSINDNRWNADTLEFNVSGNKLSFNEAGSSSTSHSLSMFTTSQNLTWTDKNAQAASKTPVSAYVWEDQTIEGNSSKTYTVTVTVAENATGTIDNGAVADDKTSEDKPHDKAETSQSNPQRKAAEELGKTGQTIAIYVLVGAGLAAIIAGAVVLIRERRKFSQKA